VQHTIDAAAQPVGQVDRQTAALRPLFGTLRAARSGGHLPWALCTTRMEAR